MSRRIALLAVAVLLTASALPAIEARLFRHPAPSPDGSQIAFSWQGDLWLVAAEGGAARRLTAHPAIERFPVWSRDGHRLVWTAKRAGSSPRSGREAASATSTFRA